MPSKKGSWKFLETALKKVLIRRVLRRCLAGGLEGGKVLRRVLRKGSKKELSRRHLEGRNTRAFKIREKLKGNN